MSHMKCWLKITTATLTLLINIRVWYSKFCGIQCFEHHSNLERCVEYAFRFEKG